MIKASVKYRLERALTGLKTSNISLEAPVFMWGTGRSGTFLLQDILSLHPGLETLRRDTRPHKGLWGDMHHGDSTPPHLRNIRPPHEGFYNFWAAGGVPQTWRGLLTPGNTKLDADAVRRRYRSLELQWGLSRKPKRVLDKAVAYILMAELIDDVFPDAYHVFLIRDPRAVVNSILRLWRETRSAEFQEEYKMGFFAHMFPPGYEKMLDRPLVETLSWQISTIIKTGFEHGRFLGSRLIPVRYEELRQSPRATVRGLLREVGLPFEPEMFEGLPESFSSYAPVWPRTRDSFENNDGLYFSFEELPSLFMVEECAVALGYDPENAGEVIGPIDVAAVGAL